MLYSAYLRSIIKQYAGRAECHALTARNDATQRNAIQRGGPCTVNIPPLKFKSFITDLMSLRNVFCIQKVIC